MTDPINGAVPEFRPAPDLLRRAEAEASAMKRTGRVDEARLGPLLALAQEAMGTFQQAWAAHRIGESHQEHLATPLIAAARIAFDLSAAPIETDARFRLRVLSACAFAMYGNFPSAAAAIRDLPQAEGLTGSELASLFLTNPGQSFDAHDPRVSVEARTLIIALRQYLSSGLRSDAEAAWAMYGAFARSAQTVWDGVLHRCCRTILAQHILLALSQLLHRDHGTTFRAYVQNLLDEGKYSLLPPQSDVIGRQGFLASNTNALVTLPTSTGKTLLAELAIASSLDDPNSVAVYVAPYVALGRQVFECLNRRAPDFVDVRGHFGTFNSSYTPVGDNRTILVVTPERLDGILRSDPRLYSRLRAVVFDEAHGVENGVRGVRLEALITRLKLQQIQHKKLRLILLSAVLTNGEDVRRWLGPDAVHYDHGWRPTARRIAFWFSSGRLAWLYGNDPLRPTDKGAFDEVDHLQLNWPTPQAPAQHHGSVKSQRPGSFQNVATLALHLHDRDPAPILIACATKASTRGVAGSIATRLALKPALSQSVTDLVTTIETSYPHLKHLSEMLKKGVAYHNASLPSDVKRGLEGAIKQRNLDFVSATTTLAEGVDMPFRSTIVFEWLVGFDANQAPMSPLVFRNIAGRCGRAGEFVEGDTVVYDNVLGNLTYTAPAVRRAAQARLLGDPPPLRSAANDNSDEQKFAVEATLSSQLIASIPENPTIDNVELALAANTYAAALGEAPFDVMAKLRADLLDTQYGEPFAMAASPMWLTPLGQAANRTGFSTRTNRAMLTFLASVQPDEPHRLAAKVLDAFGAIPEQGNYLLRAMSLRAKTTFYVKADDLEYLAANWLTPKPYVSIFVNLPAARRSKAQVTPQAWAAGAEYEHIAGQYDKFVDLLEYCFGNYLLWVLRALSELTPFASRPDPMPDWVALADVFATARQVPDDAVDQNLEPGDPAQA